MHDLVHYAISVQHDTQYFRRHNSVPSSSNSDKLNRDGLLTIGTVQLVSLESGL